MATLLHWIVGIGVMQSIVGPLSERFSAKCKFYTENGNYEKVWPDAISLNSENITSSRTAQGDVTIAILCAI